MSIYEYWIGKDIDFRSVWNDFEAGKGYIEKYHTMEVHLIRLTFEQYPSNLPLFNHEAVFKTVKGYFHELKRLSLTPYEYSIAGPLYIYDVRRDSGVWSFLGELRQLLLFAITLAEEKVIGQQIENVGKKVQIINDVYGARGTLTAEDLQRLMSARTYPDLEYAVRRLYQQRLIRVEVSREPFTGNIDQTNDSLVDVRDLLHDENSYLTKLRIILSTRFNEQELRTLCFDLGIDYDDLAGEGKSDKARELISLLSRRNRIGRFISIASRLRPDISWADS